MSRRYQTIGGALASVWLLVGCCTVFEVEFENGTNGTIWVRGDRSVAEVEVPAGESRTMHHGDVDDLIVRMPDNSSGTYWNVSLFRVDKHYVSDKGLWVGCGSPWTCAGSIGVRAHLDPDKRIFVVGPDHSNDFRTRQPDGYPKTGSWMQYPYVATEARQAQIAAVLETVRVGSKASDIVRQLGDPEEQYDMFPPVIGGRQPKTGHGIVYFVERKAMQGSANDRGEQAVRFRFDLQDGLVGVDLDGLPPSWRGIKLSVPSR
jgi:hypothetical protein